MAIEIIRRGIPAAEITYFTTCRSCGSDLSFKKADGQVVFDHRDGDFIKIACPVCDQQCTKALS